ncbi:MAG: hypothetical protein GY842_06385 [bacterium]|nr:hypothetical protein [bacterium]
MTRAMTIFVLLLLCGCSGLKKAVAEITPEPGSEPVWHDARNLGIEGRGWTDTDRFYNRLPSRAKSKVPEAVWDLSRRTAGLAVRFVTNSTRISARWDGGGAMNHMAATGNSGLDLYVRRDGRWEFCAVGRPQLSQTTATLVSGLPADTREYLLYLPLYSGVTELGIGVDAGASIEKAAARLPGKDRPIVFYGTSITQGGCAARAGMGHTAMLGRWLDREVINLGFSGAGKMEPELAALLGELDPSVYVLECLPNMTLEMVRQRVEPFVRLLRRDRPQTPILLVESPFGSAAGAHNQALRTAFDSLRDEGIVGLHYLPGADLLKGPENGTVDGVHPTDLGFYRMAVVYRPMLEKILTAGQ